MFPALPPKQNSPLRIVANQPEWRQENYLLRTNASPLNANCSPGFSVSVEDQDLLDKDVISTVASKWYVDRGVAGAMQIDGKLFHGGTGSTTIIVSAPVTLGSALDSRKDNNVHVVEVFVTDGYFTDTVGTAERPPVGTLPDGGVLTDTAYVDSFLWLVTVQPCQ